MTLLRAVEGDLLAVLYDLMLVTGLRRVETIDRPAADAGSGQREEEERRTDSLNRAPVNLLKRAQAPQRS